MGSLPQRIRAFEAGKSAKSKNACLSTYFDRRPFPLAFQRFLHPEHPRSYALRENEEMKDVRGLFVGSSASLTVVGVGWPVGFVVVGLVAPDVPVRAEGAAGKEFQVRTGAAVFDDLVKLVGLS